MSMVRVRAILELAFRWHVAISMFVYGIAKTVQFSPTSEVSAPANTLTGQELMWAFYGYSLGYAKFLGVVEMLGAVLLLFRRTTLLGCLLISGVLVNVITQDLVYDVNAGALRAACIYQGLVFAVVALNGAQVRQVWRALTARAEGSPMPWYWLALGAGLVLAATLVLEHGFTH